MCFSATASFTASSVLGVMGIVAYTHMKHKNQFLLASIPFLFAIQQAAEGIVWLSFTHAAFEPWRTSAMYTFLLFAFIVWPVWIPLSVYCMEKDDRSSWMIGAMVIVGAFVSAYLAAGLVRYDMAVTMFNCHIRYFLPLATANIYISSLLYLCATIVPFFISRLPYARIFGVLFALSYAISYFFYYHVFVSVWCFFSALLSISVIVMLHAQKRIN
ncbi:MAG: hypothetical protein NT124_05070 [Candidatus Dependentiae bacterium]|nr:hypothetical protein [Candidatus Dependentiae bacterium]